MPSISERLGRLFRGGTVSLPESRRDFSQIAPVQTTSNWIDSRRIRGRQLPLPFSPGTSFEITRKPLVSDWWIRENSLPHGTLDHYGPTEVFAMMRQGIKPSEIIILWPGR